MSKITPGPWIVSDDAHSKYERLRVEPEKEPAKANGGFVVCRLYGPDAEANARAIAALPELIGAVEGLFGVVEAADFSSDSLEFERVLEALRSALLKTGGEK